MRVMMPEAFEKGGRLAGVITSLPDIKVPSIVVVGSEDTPFLAASDYMAAKIPGAKKVVIEGAGHASNIDRGVTVVSKALENTFLLSTNFFQSGQPAAGPIRFVAFYHPYVSPCYNPLVQAGQQS